MAAAFMEAYEVPGLSVAIAIKGKPAYVEAFGVADREAGEALTPQHRFRIASISKPITSTGIFTLFEAGKLQLDSHVFGPDSILGGDYPTPLQHRSNIEQITIEHLLTHTTGGWQNDAGDPMGFDNKMNHHELIAFALEHNDLTNPPGKSFLYSNFGYCLLGRVIEKLTSQTYEQYIKDNILRRCDLSDMRIAGNTLEERATNEVKYYDQTGRDPYGMNVARMDSHGGWIATPSDLTAFFIHINGFKDTDQLLSDDTLRTMTTPTTVSYAKGLFGMNAPAYAKGLFVNSKNNWWHGGSLPGTETISVRTNADFCWSAFTNTQSKFQDMFPSLDQLVWHMVFSVGAWHPMKRA
ncbi:MAG TPA: serine hydrolase domain-containing protein [Candidatus Acidoferrum sp.]|nr:serine hydrolase domain-containing protein [Candidatus Acidoferrum sp.]